MSKKANKKLGYLPCYVGASISPFHSLFPGGAVNVLKEGFDSVSAILLWGGEDIHPLYYGEKPHHSSDKHNVAQPSPRDVQEWKAMVYAKAHQIPIIGVCRGAQFLCAFAGGKVIQDVSGHNRGTHPVTCVVRDEVVVEYKTASAHHQMMYPFDVPHEMLAWSGLRSDYYDGETPYDMAGKVDPEVVYFPNVRGLAIQGHPEWMSEDDLFVKWCLDKIEDYCFKREEENICA